MKSKIIISGMHFKAHHGYYQEEQKIGGQYILDIEMDFDVSQAAGSDELEQTVNYETVYALCKKEMAINRKLIETVGFQIIQQIKHAFPAISHLVLTIHKIHPPLDGLVDRASVRIEL